jgi:hypothetical protein
MVELFNAYPWLFVLNVIATCVTVLIGGFLLIGHIEYIATLRMKERMLRELGYPPPHCDAIGDPLASYGCDCDDDDDDDEPPGGRHVTPLRVVQSQG